MAAARFYSSTAGAMKLQADITASATIVVVDTTTGLPGTTPFTVVIDPGTTEEILDVTSVSGTTLTVTRGVDGTSAQVHAAGADIRHMATARDFREPQEHIGSTVAHGTTGNVVGTDSTQALKNKNLTDASNTFPSSLATDVEVAAEATARANADSAHAALTAAHGATGAVVGTTNAQTISNKTFSPPDAANNAVTIKGVTAQAAALSVWKDVANTVLATVSKEGTFSNAANNVGCLFFGSEGTPTSYQAFIGGKDPTKFVLNINGPVGQSFDLLRLAVNGVRLAGFQADGTLDAPNIPAGGVAGTSASKASKRLHWGTFSGTTDTSGYLTVTHGAGFTPVMAKVELDTALQHAVDNKTATTFRVRVVASDGTNIGVATAIAGSFICGE